MNIEYNIQNKNDSICFICLDKIDYYIKLNCECHNYLHQDCIKNVFIKKCYICNKETKLKKSISTNNYEISFIDVDFITNMIDIIKIKCILDITYAFLVKNPSFLTFVIYIGIIMIFTFMVIFPLAILSSLLIFMKYLKNNNYIKKLSLFILKSCVCLFLTVIILPYLT